MKQTKQAFTRIAAGALSLLLLLVLCAGCVRIDKPQPNDIVVLFTNDVHCGIDTNIGYAGLASYIEYVEKLTPYLTLVDCGDAVQGEFIGTVSEGEYIVDIMNELGYDLAVPGNHEFDYGMEQLEELIYQSKAQYLACNITYTGEERNRLSEIKPYEIVEYYDDISVAYIGVATPESITKSTPAYFMEDGEYVYDFARGNDGQDLYACVQCYVDECRDQGADYVVVLSHLGDAAESSPYTSVELIRETVGIDVILDGHAHSVIPTRVEVNRDGEEVLLSSTGTKLANIGQLVITASGNVIVGLISDYSYRDSDTARFINGIKAEYQEEMNRVVANSDIALSCYSNEGIRLVRNRETAIGNLCADAYRTVAGADIAVVNGGGIRADIAKGSITYADMLAVHPFGNTLCMVEATGQEILDCLEIAYMHTRAEISENGQAVGEDGSFLQVSGLKLTIDTSISTPVRLDEMGMLQAIEGERRVKDVQVLGKDGTYTALDPNATYLFASHNYLIKASGGGHDLFADNTFLIDEGISDYQVLIEYLTKHLSGSLKENYSAVQNRITVK